MRILIDDGMQIKVGTGIGKYSLYLYKELKKHLEKWNYDVYVIEDFENNFTKYQVFHKLSPSTLKYFNLLKGESYLDDFGNEFKCISHTIEY